MYNAILINLYVLLFSNAQPAKIKHVNDATSATRLLLASIQILTSRSLFLDLYLFPPSPHSMSARVCGPVS